MASASVISNAYSFSVTVLIMKQSISRGTVTPASFECCLRDLNDLSECVECEMMAISGTANFAKNTVATAQCCMQIDTFAEIIYTVSGNC